MRFLLAHVAALVDFDGGLAGAAIGDGDFDLEGVSTVGCGWPSGDGIKIRLQFLVQPFQSCLSPIGTMQSVRGAKTRVF